MNNDTYKKEIPNIIRELEKTTQTTTNQVNEYSLDEDIPFIYQYDYLYHGIRNQKYLEILEEIFKTRKILAGKYIKNYYNYSDNCNKGEYVSLLKYNKSNYIAYQTFIEENISLLVTPVINAIETKYIDYNTWNTINKQKLSLKNLYSYMIGECLVKDYVDFSYIKAIGFPYKYLTTIKGQDYTNNLLNDLYLLMQRYNITLSIVDPSKYNDPILKTENHTYNRIRKNKWNIYNLNKKNK